MPQSLAVNAEANVTARRRVLQPQRSEAQRLQSAIRRRERLKTQLVSSEYALSLSGGAIGDVWVDSGSATGDSTGKQMRQTLDFGDAKLH
jgi:hypothetical protein